MEWIEISLLGSDLSCLVLTALCRSGYQQNSTDNMILPYIYCDRYPSESSTGAVVCMFPCRNDYAYIQSPNTDGIDETLLSEPYIVVLIERKRQ